MSVLKLGTDLRNYIVDLIKSTTRDIYYPIGKVYLTVGNEDPNQTIGGTWVKISGGHLYACVNSITNSSYTGTGTQSHTLTANQSGLRWHDHSINLRLIYCAKGSSDYWTVPWGSGDQGTMSTNGNGGWNAAEGHSHNISYIGVWVWKRTA